MTPSNFIARLKLAVTPFLAISLAISLLALYKSKTSTSPHEEQANHHLTGAGRESAGEAQQRVQAIAEHTRSSPDPHLSDITVVILNDGRDRPLEFKMAGKLVKMPPPSSWPHIGDGASDQDRYLAAIIDTADILKTNGFKADAPFSLVVGDIELNNGNTFRIKGNDQTTALGDGNDPAVEYRTQAGEQGIWRALKFKNIVVSHAQVPSLEQHLVAVPRVASPSSYREPTSAGTTATMTSTLPTAPTPDTGQVTPLEEPTPESTAKYVEALDSPDPAVRADAIQTLIINGYREATPSGNSNAKMESIIAKSLMDKNPTVRNTAMDALDGYEGSLPQGTLSHMALNDSNPGLRIQALDLLVERFGAQAKSTVQEARSDPDPRVVRMASELLTEMSSTPEQ